MSAKMKIPETWLKGEIDRIEMVTDVKVVARLLAATRRTQNALIDCVRELLDLNSINNHGIRNVSERLCRIEDLHHKELWPENCKPEEAGVTIQCDHCSGTDLRTQELIGEKCTQCNCIMKLRDKPTGPKERGVSVSSQLEKCPACGSCEFHLDAVVDVPSLRPMIWHGCNKCHHVWMESAIEHMHYEEPK